MDNHWAVTTSSGRRVSLLCEEQHDYAYSSYAPSNASSTPPPSPDYRRPYAPLRTDSIGSACSSTSSLGTVSSQGLYSPRTPPSIGLPSLEKLLPVPETALFHPKYQTDLDPALPIDDALSPPQSTVVSTPSSPKTATSTTAAGAGAAAGAPPKRSSRRYACHCGKSFTTSGHLARHTRIHTGEKNYVCPEAGCTARFSRQDNCMQHYRTHQGGSGTKRAARKRRLSSTPSTPTSAPAATATTSSTTTTTSPSQPTYVYPNYFEPFGSEGGGGLAALANIACSGYS